MYVSSNKIKLFFVYVLILSCLISVYFNTLNNPFIWDDEALISRNPLIRDPRFLGKIFTSDLFYGSTTGSNFFRPLQTISYMLDYHFWQMDPNGYHITNILLQSFVSFLVFLLTYFLLGNIAISLSSGLLFSLSPIHTEAVTYISGRAEMLMAIFLISSLILFIKSQNSNARNGIALLLSIISFVLALISKELTAVFPLVVFSYVFYYARDRLHKKSFFLKNLLPFFIFSGAYIILRLFFLKFATLRPPALARFPFFVRITVLPKVFFTYIKLLLFPVNLHMSRELIRPTTFIGFVIAWVALITIVVVCVHYLRYKEQRMTASFLLSWFLIFILPQSGLFAINAFVSEHFVYLSSISFFIAVSSLLYKYLRRQLFIFSIVCLSVFYGLLTISRNLEWQDPVIFFERIIKFSPASFQAHNNLGLQYQYRHLYEAAIYEYRKAIEIMPDLLEAHSNLADLYFKMGRLEDAKREYAIVERTAPGSKAGEIQNNIGAIYETEGLLDEALNKYKRALQLDTSLGFTHFNIARIYFSKGNFNLAAQEILKSLSGLSVSESNLKEHLRLIEEYLNLGQQHKCAVTFYNELGIRLAQANFFDAALASFQRVLELEPRYADGHFNLGLAYWKKGLQNQAALEFKYALKINPGHYRAKALLSEIRKNSLFYRLLY